MDLDEQAFRICRECLHKANHKRQTTRVFCSLDGREVKDSDKGCINFFDHLQLRDHRHQNQ